jgi:hypothetical protein
MQNGLWNASGKKKFQIKFEAFSNESAVTWNSRLYSSPWNCQKMIAWMAQRSNLDESLDADAVQDRNASLPS